MTALTVTPANVSADQNQGSVVRNYQAGGALTVGQAVYLDSNNYVQAADANTSSVTTARGVGIVVNTPGPYGDTSIPSGGYCSICVEGPVYGFSGLTPGAYGWVSKTAGEIDDTAPTTATYQYILGYAVAEDTFFVNPGITSPTSVT